MNKAHENINTLEQARQYLRANFGKGCVCPACGQFTKLYKRGITSAMAYGLILIYKSGKTDYFHIEDYLKDINCPSSIRGDISKLKLFGLLHKLDAAREDGSNRNGFYKITQDGIKFIKGQLKVPQYVKIYNNRVYSVAENYITIKEALKNKFNYEELMDN